VIHHGRVDLHEEVRWIAARTNHRGLTGSLGEGLVGVDVFIGVSAPDLLTQADIEAMAPGAIVSAGANPVSGFEPEIAAMDAAVVATGRSDLANQINNVLASRWVFRGLLDAHSHRVTDDMLLAAAPARSAVGTPEELNATYIVPSVVNPTVTTEDARAVQAAAVRAPHRDRRPTATGGPCAAPGRSALHTSPKETTNEDRGPRPAAERHCRRARPGAAPGPVSRNRSPRQGRGPGRRIRRPRHRPLRHPCHLRTRGIPNLNENLPRAIVVIDAEDRVRTFLPELDEPVHEGLLTIEKVDVVRYAPNAVEHP